MAAETVIEIKWNYTHNDFEFAAPVETMENFFRAGPKKRDELALYLEEMAKKCRAGEWPFRLIGT